MYFFYYYYYYVHTYIYIIIYTYNPETLNPKLRYAPHGNTLGNSWRIAADVRDYSSLYNAIRRSEVKLSEVSMGKRMPRM
jgi:hypothetical protein